MKTTLLLFLLSVIPSFGIADTATPYLAIAPAKDFAEGKESKLYFYSLMEKGLQGAGMCVGDECTPPAGGTIGYRKVAKQKEETTQKQFVCESIQPHVLKEGEVIAVNYTVDQDPQAYRREYKLVVKDPVAKTYEFELVEEEVLEGTYPVAPAEAAAVGVAAATDPFTASFIAELNSIRARSGCGPVFHDPALDYAAYQNNLNYLSTNQPHGFMGIARRQNWAAGSHELMSRWMNSPGHQSALLDPSITRVGLNGISGGAYGSSWTYSAY